MAVGPFSTRLWAVIGSSRPWCRSFLIALLISPLAISGALAQAVTPGAALHDSTSEPNVYPVGDAIGVYRSVLDLLYIDGKDRPKVVVMWDSVMREASGPCAFTECKNGWTHKSRIDSSAVLAFVHQGRKRPRIIDFGYTIPIVRASNDDFERVRQNGYEAVAARPAGQVGPVEAFWAGFRQTYPDTWGYVALSKVGFNRAHTQALISVFQVCGEDCRSNEIIFLKRIGKEWRVIERIADYTQTRETSGNLRYRGPIATEGGPAQIVALDSSGRKPRSESDDAARVYRAVFDKLYSFFGESPKRLVVLDLHPRSESSLPPHRSSIDAATLSNYAAVTQIRDAVPRFSYRIPITWITDAGLRVLARDGSPLAKMAAARFEEEASPLWYGFRARYPGAWGYIALGRVAFNRAHSEALVFTSHFCGSMCVNADTWFLERHGNDWTIVERIPRESAANWTLDGTRYLGPEAKPQWYRRRRVHGVFTSAETGDPLANLPIQVKYYMTATRYVTDAHGRYSIDNLPLAGISLLAKCPDRLGAKWLLIRPIAVTPGLDMIFNPRIDFADCQE